MANIRPDATMNDFQTFIKDSYALLNDRQFSTADMLSNIQRFAMRGLKGIRKNDVDKARLNFIISFSWFVSLFNRFNVDIGQEAWKRFPYLCSYCASCSCICKAEKVEKRREVPIRDELKPKTLREFQEMFNKIYPASGRTLEHAAVHLAEEIGELSETFLAYRGERKEKDFEGLIAESGDFLSCLMGVFNSLNLDLAEELSKHYHENCNECHKMPCMCSYIAIKEYRS
jgi:NTP pyrophosphatase (non-canonical NTP hydrolase)